MQPLRVLISAALLIAGTMPAEAGAGICAGAAKRQAPVCIRVELRAMGLGQQRQWQRTEGAERKRGGRLGGRLGGLLQNGNIPPGLKAEIIGKVIGNARD
jgi:hypothetical protein